MKKGVSQTGFCLHQFNTWESPGSAFGRFSSLYTLNIADQKISQYACVPTHALFPSVPLLYCAVPRAHVSEGCGTTASIVILLVSCLICELWRDLVTLIAVADDLDFSEDNISHC